MLYNQLIERLKKENAQSTASAYPKNSHSTKKYVASSRTKVMTLPDDIYPGQTNEAPAKDISIARLSFISRQNSSDNAASPNTGNPRIKVK